MSLAAILALSCAAGAALGCLHFLALWETVRRLPRLSRPGLWMAMSMLVRLAAALAAFVFLARWGGLPALTGALLGFVVARTVFLRRSRRAAAQVVSPS